MIYRELLGQVQDFSDADLERPVQILFGQLVLTVLRIDPGDNNNGIVLDYGRWAETTVGHE
jgi:hypothetical protein